MFPRSSGILLHPTSFPGRFGIGELGPEAHRFIEFLARARQRIWQVLPLGPTGYGDSPYQSFSAFAGNPLLIGLDGLAEEGLLSREDLAGAPAFPSQAVDYGAVRAFKLPLLARAYENFQALPGRMAGAFQSFCAKNAAWLEDYALFMSLKEVHGGEAVWTRWHPGDRPAPAGGARALAPPAQAPGRVREVRAVPLLPPVGGGSHGVPRRGHSRDGRPPHLCGA